MKKTWNHNHVLLRAKIVKQGKIYSKHTILKLINFSFTISLFIVDIGM